MKWLNPDEAEKLLHGYATEPQTFILSCDVNDLASELSIQPRHISTDEGVAAPTNEWVGLIDERPVVVQQELVLGSHPTRAVTVVTPYIRAGTAVEEWSTLRELERLPRPIRSSRPLFIQSHVASGDHVVCRPNARGWHDIVYRAASDTDAKHLLSYLQTKDPWNESCFIAKSENRGEWAIFSERRPDRILGRYPDVDSALHVACTMSDDSFDELLVVKDLAEKRTSRVFRIARGRVAGAIS